MIAEAFLADEKGTAGDTAGSIAAERTVDVIEAGTLSHGVRSIGERACARIETGVRDMLPTIFVRTAPAFMGGLSGWPESIAAFTPDFERT
jgi:hypothetical protein